MKNSSTTIAQTRKSLGLSQLQLADRAGISRTFIALMEQGWNPPRSGSKQAVAEALGLPMVELFPTNPQTKASGPK